MCTPGVGELTEDLLAGYIEQDFGVTLKGLVKKWDTEDDVNDVVLKIQKCNNLKYLELEGNTLGVDAAKAIGKALESKQELGAALWKDLFTGRLKNEIPKALQFLLGGVDLANARLQYLELSDNAIGPLGMIGLAPFFRSNSSFSLKVLICTNNGLGPQGAEQFSKALIECRNLSLSRGGEVFNLKKFVCGRNRMQNKGAMAIAKFIKECDSLEEIHMHENSIYWQAQSELAEAFLCNPNLRVINLNDNTIVGKGVRTLSNTFQKLKYLKDLNLGDCLLRNSGAIHVVKSIKDLPQLEGLVLEGNEIGKSSGIEIAEMLRSNRTLRSVNFNANCFGVEGTQTVERLLRDVDLSVEDMEDTDDEEQENDDGEGEEQSNDGESEDEEESGEYEDTESDAESDENEYEEMDPVFMVWKFVSEPTVENYQAVPPPGFTEYLYDLVSEERPQSEERQPYEICIQAAVEMVQAYARKQKTHELCENVFSELMSEAIRNATSNANEFSTCLLINMGLFRSENKVFVREELSDTVLIYLRDWLIQFPQGPEMLNNVLTCLKTAFKNVRPQMKVNKLKLTTLVDSVLMERGILVNTP